MKHFSDLSGAKVLACDERSKRVGSSATNGQHDQALAGIIAAKRALAAGETVDLVQVHRAYAALFGNTD